MTVHQDEGMFVARLDPGTAIEHAFGEGRGGYCYLLDGDADLNDDHLATRRIA